MNKEPLPDGCIIFAFHEFTTSHMGMKSWEEIKNHPDKERVSTGLETVTIWEPFEDYSIEELQDIIEGLARRTLNYVCENGGWYE